MARSFNGSTDLINLGNSSALQISSPITVSAWCYPTSVGGLNQVFMKNNANGNLYGVIADNNKHFTAQYNTGSSISGATTLVANVWYHVVCVFNGASSVVYVNGASDGTGTTTVTNPGAVAAEIGQDNFNGGRGWAGNIADVAIWNTNLSAGNVTSLFNGVRPVNVNSANLVGWWPLDGFDSPEDDLSGNGNTGTLTGTKWISGPPALWRISGHLPGLAAPAAGLSWMINRRNKLGWMPSLKKIKRV